MTGLEYMRSVCPTTKRGKDPLREDVIDAFEDGIAEGWKQHKEKQWKPTPKQLQALKFVCEYFFNNRTLHELYDQLKVL